jgi:Domain of unknown function (DUF4153)
MDDGREVGTTRTPHLATATLILGASLGVLGDLLFHQAEVGLNIALWIGALAGAGWFVHRRAGRSSGTLLVLLGTACFFAGSVAWRASPFLQSWDLVAVAAAAVTVAVHLRGALRSADIAEYGRGLTDVARDVTIGPVQALGEGRWRDATRRSNHVPAITTGVLLAIPVVLVFGALLAAADPAMDALVTTLFHWDLASVFTHLAVFGVTAWLATGWLRRLRVAPSPSAGGSTGPRFTLNATELAIPLGALTLLLAIFIGVQARYLFGGEAIVRLTGLTYAQFARRGFFELVLVSGLALPLLIGAQRLVDRSVRVSVQNFRALAPTLAVLVGLVMVSALARMRLYVENYGLTEDRFYATAFMLWLGMVFVWLVVTEFRGRLERFPSGAVAAGFLVLAGLNAVNPDAVIARTNIGRATSRLELDAAYLGRLSTDAVPALRARWGTLDVGARCATLKILDRSRLLYTDWRSWSWSAWRAEGAAPDLTVAPESCGESG